MVIYMILIVHDLGLIDLLDVLDLLDERLGVVFFTVSIK
jgi:hypothetical protein